MEVGELPITFRGWVVHCQTVCVISYDSTRGLQRDYASPNDDFGNEYW